MKKILFFLAFCSNIASINAQLSVEQIMQDPKISVGALPSNVFWSEDSKTVYFSWNPENNKADSLYSASVPPNPRRGSDAANSPSGAGGEKPLKVAPEVRRSLPSAFGDYNRDRTKKVYTKNGDIYLVDCKTGAIRLLVNTVENESNPSFSAKGDKIIFSKGNNLFSIDRKSVV